MSFCQFKRVVADLMTINRRPSASRRIRTFLLRSMTESFAYRGPDDEGFFFEGPVGLGHRLESHERTSGHLMAVMESDRS
jgi:hypothetical protein